jgi:hypothetical protein
MVGSFDADRWIAHRNVARSLEYGAPMDVAYLASLSEDASGLLPAVKGHNPLAGEALHRAWAESWSAHRSGGWRSLRGLGTRRF